MRTADQRAVGPHQRPISTRDPNATRGAARFATEVSTAAAGSGRTAAIRCSAAAI